MGRGQPASKLCLTEAEQLELAKGLSIRKGAADERLRIQIVLSCAQGVSGTVIARQLHTTTQTVSKWRRRYAAYHFAGLSDAPRSGRPRTVSDEQVQAVVDKVRTTVPTHATHWSVRRVSTATGVSAPTVQRIWHAFGLKPHLQKTFKLSTDPNFVDKVRDGVGLYLAPPDRALVLCVDEKSQIQALDRTQPGWPLSFGPMATHTHDDKRHGTTSLLAALEVATGKVMGPLKRRHRSVEFLQFLKRIDKEVTGDLAEDQQIHLIMDHYGTPLLSG